MLGKNIVKDVLIMFGVFVGAVAIIGLLVPSVLWASRPSFQFEDKDVLLSNLREYLGREADIDVRIENETTVGTNPVEYKYDLISDIDSQKHGWLKMLVDSKGRVWSVFLQWTHNGEDKLQRSGELIVSAITDNMIPDWQQDDGQPNRNLQILEWIDSNTEYDRTYNMDVGDHRVLQFQREQNQFIFGIHIES